MERLFPFRSKLEISLQDQKIYEIAWSNIVAMEIEILFNWNGYLSSNPTR